MSRPIKFRAWDKEAKAYVGDVRLGFSLYEIALSPFEHADKLKDLEFEQYTGLKDKNGKEIYEGDIVKAYSRRKLLGEYQVIWNEDCSGFECESLKPLVDGGGRMLKDIRVFNEISIQFRVIGNIHENPELLEKGEE